MLNLTIKHKLSKSQTTIKIDAKIPLTHGVSVLETKDDYQLFDGTLFESENFPYSIRRLSVKREHKTSTR